MKDLNRKENLNKEELQPFIIFGAMCGAYCTVHADPTFKIIDALGACTAVAILSNGKKMSLSSLQYSHEFAVKLITKHQHTLLLQTNDAFSTGPFI